MLLRGLLSGIAAAILALALTVAIALVTITTQMEKNNRQLLLAVESIHTAEQIEIHLLRHSREHRLLESTNDPHHDDGMHAEEEKLRQQLSQAGQYVGSPEEAHILEDLRRHAEEYLAHGKDAKAPGQGDVGDDSTLIQPALEDSEQLVKINLDEAAAVTTETRRWEQVANLLAATVSTALLAGIVMALWSIRRYLYRPLLFIRDGLVRFRPGASGVVVPEAGPGELREIAHEFNVMAARLERQREVQLRFIAGVAHDLRNPLSALKLNASLVRPDRPLPPEEKVRERFALVVRQVERIEQMVEDLLDTARIEAGKLELRLTEHDLRGLLREAVALHEETSAEHELVLHVPDEPVLVRGDATRLSQVLNNLLSNAIKYSPRGGQVRVELTLTSDDAWVAVTDPGVGIPAAELESIFEPFRRSTTTRDTIPGVGLGLSVGRRIIEAHGGHIHAESQEGTGTTFRFRVPRAPRPPG
ncbi:MAG: ATP-binding protein [Hyalangium sp.]|uniref:sensor histidine kinase n=1 Tax=Hyalangium sp. TaxID=2028555 RepID=UPI00389ADC3A